MVIGTNETAKIVLSKVETNQWTAMTPPPRYDLGLAPIYNTNKALLFGGQGNKAVGNVRDWNDTWCYDRDQNTWTEIISDPHPSDRNGHGMVGFDNDDKVLVFGGDTDSGFMNDTWIFDLSQGNWTQINTSTSPRPSHFMSLAMLAPTGNIVLFGGWDWKQMMNETWIYNISDNGWTNVTPSLSPSGRHGASMASIPNDGRALLFGGWDRDTNICNDTWIYNYSDNSWTKKNPAISPPRRFFSSMSGLQNDDKIVLFAGESRDPDYPDDTWIYDVGDDAWTNVTGLENPAPRQGHRLATLSNSGEIIMFGGEWGHVAQHADLHVYNASQKKWINLDNIPPGRVDCSIAAIPGTDAVLTFGRPGYTETFETWTYELNESKWVKKSPATSPSYGLPRMMASLATDDKAILLDGNWSNIWVYDYSEDNWTKRTPPVHPSDGDCVATVFGNDRILLYDGQNNKTCMYDYSDNNWTDLAPWNAPTFPRDSITMAPTSDGTIFVLFGGKGWSNTIYNDTWIYNLKTNNWTQQITTTMPPDRYANSLATIYNDDKVLMFGGDSANETWIYDVSDNSWSKKCDGIPPARHHSSLAAFSDRDAILLYGGLYGDAPVCDTYIFTQGQYVQSGDFITQPFDTKSSARYLNISWNGTVPAGTEMSMQIRTANTTAELNATCFRGPDGCSTVFYTLPDTAIWAGHNGERWIQIRVYMNTTNKLISPALWDLTLRYNRLPITNLTKPQADVWINNATPIFAWDYMDPDSGNQTGFQWQADNESAFSTTDYDSGEIGSNKTFYVPSRPLPDGTWYWRVRTMDGDLDWGEYNNHSVVKIDVTPPEPFSPAANPGCWTNASVLVSFSTTDNTSGIDHYLMQIDNGDFSPQDSPCILSDLLNGIHNIVIRAYDNATNYYDGNVTVYTDKDKPNSFAPVADPAGWTNGDVRISFVTTDPTSGVGRYEVGVDGTNFSLQASPYTLPLIRDGIHNITVRAYDLAQNRVDGTVQVFIDRTPPNAFRAEASPKGWTNATPKISFSTTDILSGIRYYDVGIDGSDFSVQTSPYQLPMLEDGQHDVTVRAFDKANNSINSTTPVYIDKVPPTDLTLSINNGAAITSSLRVSLSILAADPTSGVGQMCFSGDGKSFSPWENYTELRSWDLFPGLGKKTVHVMVKDRAGNVAKPASAQISYDPSATDTSPPEITDIGPIPGSEIEDRTPVIGAGYSDEKTGGSGINLTGVRLFLDGIDMTRSSQITPTGISLRPSVPLSFGSHNVSLEVRDDSSLRNLALRNWSFTVSNLPSVAFMSLYPPSVTVQPNATIQFMAKGFDTNGQEIVDIPVQWNVSGPIGDIDASGLFHARAIGAGLVSAGCRSLVATANVTVVQSISARPVAVIDHITPARAEHNDTVAFVGHGTPDDRLTDYLWSSDKQGFLSDTASFSKSGLLPVNHTIYFQVKDSLGIWSIPAVFKLNIFINRAPIAGSLEIGKSKIATGERTSIIATGSMDEDGDAIQYLFDFGDSTDSGWISEPIASHNFNRTGRYSIRFKVRDARLAESGWSPAKTVAVEAKNGPNTSGAAWIILSVIVTIIGTGAAAGFILWRKKRSIIGK